jgi:hypothetical protein
VAQGGETDDDVMSDEREALAQTLLTVWLVATAVLWSGSLRRVEVCCGVVAGQ